MKVHTGLKNQLIVSTILLIPALFLLIWVSFGEFRFARNTGEITNHTFMDIFLCIAFGLVAGLIIGYVT